ncbi:PH domain-containing protein [Staphylococcus auricularis]|uniref:PH domain-containing protein n=1 Tax=Staphylococcus auricularis TaxID=29379 RepID=UPI00242A74E6|nr:PH domain-containing protein [Staphylococcus auricularis]
MSEPQKLHPISYLSGLISVIKQNFIIIIIFLVFNIRDFDFTDPMSYIMPSGFMILIIVLSVYAFLEVYQTRYWIEGDHFIVKKGILTKKRTELNIRRIQSMDTNQGIIQQLVKGVELKVTTPSDGIVLDTISKSQSDMLQQALREKQRELKQAQSTDTVETNEAQSEAAIDTDTIEEKHRIYHMTVKELLLMAMTSGAIGVAFAVIGPIVGNFTEFIPWDDLFGEFAVLGQSVTLVVIATLMIGILISYIVGTLIVIVRNFNYTVDQSGNHLYISYGLLTVKHITVPVDRMQAIVENQSFLRKLFGYTSMSLIITSDMTSSDVGDDNVEDGKVKVLPFIKRDKAYELMKDLIPSMHFEEPETGMPWRGYHRHFWIPAVVLFAIAGIVHYYFTPWGYAVADAITVIMALHALASVKMSGFNVADDEMVVRDVTTFGIEQSYFKHNKVLGMEMDSNPFLVRSELLNFNFVIAKGIMDEDIGLDFVEQSKVEALEQWYLRGENHD